MSWYLNAALTRFRNAVNARWPRRDKTSDGTIGNEEHKARTSDHNEDPDGSVDAWDMDVDGVDVEECKRAFERHESSSYWIHNDQISFRSEGWKPRSYAYAGPKRNKHQKHVHFNTREAFEDSTKPWPIGEDDDVSEKTDRIVEAYAWGKQSTTAGEPVEPVKWRQRDEQWQARMEAAVGQLLGKDFTDEPAIIRGVLAGLDPAAIAAAIPRELAAQVADELAARLSRPAAG